MQTIFNMALWLLIASVMGGILGLAATFAGDDPSGVMRGAVQVWAEKGWLLPYSSAAAVLLGAIYYFGNPGSGKSPKE